MFSPFSIPWGTCGVCEVSDGHWQGGFANRVSCVMHTLPLCVAPLVSVLANIFICDMWRSFVHSCVLCTCDNSAFVVAVSGDSKREQGWVGKMVGGDPGEMQL